LLKLFQTRGLDVAPQHQEQRLPTGATLWTLGIAGGDVRITFQERQGLLVFATIEHSMFGESQVPDRLCEALESVGWQADNENVG
jgi:hypothetical protein